MKYTGIIIPIIFVLLLVPVQAFAQTDFGSTSNQTISGFEPLDDIVMTPPPSTTPLNEYTFTPPQEIEITTPITGLMTLPEERIESFTFEKFQDGFTWEVDEDGFLFKQWDADRLGTNPEPKLQYPQVTENYTIEQIDDETFSYSTHTPYVSDGYDWKPYVLGQDENVVQVQVAGGTVVFDKVAGAVTIFNDYETVIDSDSYTVRTALLDSDVWASLDVNNADVETTVVEDGDKVTVSFIRENNEGLFKTEYVIGSGQVKTTAYFTNYIYDNNKFAFTQTLNLPDSIITLNEMESIDLTDYVGQSFPREVLEQNEDLILNIKDMYYSSGLGFENLWSVNVTSPTKVSLDYANVDETQTAINETVELDPTFGISTTAGWIRSVGVTSTPSQNCPVASDSKIYYLRNYNSYPSHNGCRAPIAEFDVSSIPNDATVTSVNINYEIDWVSGASNGMNAVDWNDISIKDHTTTMIGWDDATNASSGQSYVTNETGGNGSAGDVVNVNLGTLGNTNVENQLNASTSVDGVADWFSVGFPFSNTTQQSYVRDIGYKNVGMSVVYTSPPSSPTNVTTTANGSNVDLSWSASESNSDYIVSSNAKINYGTGIALPATWVLWQGGASPTTPTMGVGGVIGTAFDFNGSTDAVGDNYVTGYPNNGIQPTQGSISVWIKPEATSASAGNPIGGSGLGSYWMQNGQWSSYGYPTNSFNIGSLYSNANAYNMQQWNHLVATVDSSGGGTLVGSCPFSSCANIWTIYMNGSPVQMYSYPGGTGGGVAINGSPQSAGNLLANMMLGGQFHPNPQLKYPFDGKIDEFSSWNKVLSQSEVTTLYNSGNGNTPDSISSNNNMITYFPLDDLSAPLPNMAVTVDPLPVTYDVKRDGTSLGTTTNISFTDTTTAYGTPYQFSLTASTSNGTSATSQSGYVVSSDAVTSDGTNNGATTGVGGIVGNAWSFAGTGLTAGADYVSGIDTELQDSSGNGYTMSMWFKPSALNGSSGTSYEILGAVNFFNQFVNGDGSVYVTGGGQSSAGLVSNGSWHHLVTSVDSSDNATVYLNGSSIMTGSVPSWASQNQGEFYIGARASSNQYGFGGSIDEVSVWDRNLSSSEVSTLYNSGSGNTPHSLNLGNDLTQYYNFEQTGNTLTNMAVTEDPSSYAITLAVPAPTNLSASLNAPNVDLSWTGASGATGYKIETSTDSPDVDSYDTSTEVGFSTSGNTITKDSGSSGWGDSKIQSTQTFTVGTPFSFDFSPSTSSATGYIGLGQGTLLATTSGQQQFPDSMKFGYFISGESKVVEYDDTATAKNIQASFNASDNYRILVEADGTVKYYRQASGTGSFNLEYTSANTASGTYYVQSNMHTNGQGFIDIISPTLLSWTNVVANQTPNDGVPPTSGLISDIPLDNSTATWTGTETYGSGVKDDSVSFDGSSYITLSNESTYDFERTDPFSVSLWLKTGTEQDIKMLVGKSEINTLGWHIWMRQGAAGDDNGDIHFNLVNTDSTNEIETRIQVLPMFDDKWHHLAWTYDGTSDVSGVRGYWDGVDISQGSGTNNLTSSILNNLPVSIGDTPNGGGRDYTGSMDELKVFDRELTSAEVATLYASPTWDTSQSLGMSVSGDTVTNSLSSNGWDNYIRTIGTFSSGDITYKTPDAVTGSNIFVGLGQDPIYLGYNSYSSVDYAMNVCNSDCDTIKIWEEGSNVDTVTGTGFDPATSILKISMDGSGIVTYYHNGTLISTSSNAGSGSYYGHTAINESGKSVSILNESYSHTAPTQNSDNYYQVKALIGSAESTANTGSSLAVGGTPDAPTGLTTTFNNSTMDMDLAWTAPVNNNGSAVTGYKIETSLDGSTWTTVLTTTNANITYSHVSPTIGVLNYYKVSAVNAYGTGSPTGIVNALAGGPPDAPTNLTVSYNSPNADLTWVAPTVNNGSAVIGYKVETSLDNLSWSPVTVLTNTNVTYSHTNPTVGVDNYYRVSAINSIGTGVPGNVASVLAALVPTAPLTLTTTQTVPFAHDLSWSVPSNDGGSPVTNYKVYRDGSLITTLGNVTTYQDNTMQHIAHTHSYEVSAVNLVGESPMSNASSITSWNVPDATTGVTATARAGQQNELNWTAPSNGGSPITGYHIKSSTDNITFTDVVATTTTQPYNHTGLTQGTTYYYQISAISAVGEGAFGTASATVGDVPDAPVSLTVVPQAGMQATITITIPNDNGYAISSYTLHRSSDNFATFTVLNSQTSNVIVDYPLNIGTSYQYKALATNSLGDSALSVASATALAGDVPSTPVAPGTVVAST